MAIDIKRFLIRFVEEAREHLRQMEERINHLETTPQDIEAVHALFRSAHTIKGSSRMLKLLPITDTAHALEDVLGDLREGNVAFTAGLGRLLRQACDALASQVDQLEAGNELSPADAALCAALKAPLSATATAPTEVSAPVVDQPPVSPAESPAPPPDDAPAAVESSAPEVRLKTAATVRVPLVKMDELIKLMGEVISSHARLRQRVSDIRGIEREADVSAALSAPLHRFARQLQDDVFEQALLMEELHNKALIMRMLPLALVFEPAARMVRELGRSMGKEIECKISGMDIELDRQVIERLNDPIVHLLRNAVDHAIEPPETREAAGKPRYGTVQLNARQDGGFVVIELSDDGAGLPLALIRDKAIRKGLLSTEQAAALPENELIELIFTPGFSTSAIITDVSGRGVGMDVVKRCVVDELQGAISVETLPGQGTTFSLRLPLSLAMMRVLLVQTGTQCFGLSAQYIAQLLEVEDRQLFLVAKRQTVVIDNEFVPVLDLAALLSLPSPAQSTRKVHLLVVVRVRNAKLALKVNDLVDEQDMVIKPLPAHLRDRVLIAGMVMTGNSELISILHAPALMDLARHNISTTATRTTEASSTTGQRVLVVDDSLNTREIEKDLLEAHGYQITLAEDGLDGLQKARSQSFDAILTDVEMPNMDGFSLTAALRQDERYRHTPIIIITSREKEEDKRRGIEVGADAYIIKGSFDQNNLLDTLKNLLG
ncbi:hybrid sensor histidine kinase/response regulator [Thiorhodospira sibirica]|uniref:hybrid sensor histidine kinase/response regulator n=1 Tax=Thiorhodospira sibirica TaxID=154347 RepID=UPI00022C4C4B|nr:hybrid sensor histidine kinase/response regulator [Thiorhodospira sibirica]